MKFKHTALFAVTFFFLNAGTAQIPENVKKEIQYRINNHINPSIAVGVLDSSGVYYYVKGYKDLENKIKADENTLYEIGSITKTFTSLLLAKYAVGSIISIDDEANEFLPDSIDLTDKKGVSVTLKNLSTHSSGLPRIPNNINVTDQMNPYANYTRSDMFSFLSHYIPRNVGKKFEYSNLGAGLLGEILSISQNDTYQNLVKKKILTPLNLKNTYFKVPESQKENYAKGYLSQKEVPHWKFQAMAAAGGIRSTIKDLVKYGESYLKNDSPLYKAQEYTKTVQFKDQEGQLHGLAWFINPEGIIFHGGGTGGFRTFIAIDGKHGKVVAIMTNSGSSPAEDIAEYLMDPDKNPLDFAKEEMPITAEELMDFEGNYINDGLNMTYNFSLVEDALHAQLNNQPEFPVYYQGESTFFYKIVKAKIVFERDENNTVVGLILYQNGQEIPFIKTNP
ncbi:serine hydrolase domain-containing protein [Galbibacter pacificus]|uniref:Serine hydrolase n=1 Tax=Galbibacter pacificus TaxID=2996052 RepID=A0ABT6FVK7_9FLAO|nr:serine hydrolase domain-containing protein [Galbibacter pacificus]MDG3583785.1 serine hydrolase [Galbibacter pacificus]MDG3587297.1 serine hydrolase [Galbibacter pacificus]